MTGTNQFLNFASAATNILSQTDYAALPDLTAGSSSGIVPSPKWNKMFRQALAISNLIGSFIAAQGQNANDDGNASALLTAFETALSSYNNLSVVGQMRNAKMIISSASATATFTADEIILETALGGTPYKISSFNKSVNLATTGAGGMDTGAAPVSGYVALYAIYNPTTATAALLAVNATSSAAPNVYGGANMPSGYTASALVSVWATNSSGQFVIGVQRDRLVARQAVTVLSTSTNQTSYTSLSVAGAIPLNAVSTTGFIQVTSATAGNPNLHIASDANGTDETYMGASAVTSVESRFDVMIGTAQTIYWHTDGTGYSLVVEITKYAF